MCWGSWPGSGPARSSRPSAFELCVPAYRESDRAVIAVALAAGALCFYGTDRVVARHAPPGEHGSVGIALGALLDGVPESVAIAISLIAGGAVSGPMVIAVLASNLPEGMASTPGFRRAGWPTRASSACGSRSPWPARSRR